MSIDILSRDTLQKAQSEKETIESEFSKEITILEENSKKNIVDFKEKLKSKYEEEISNQKEKILGSYQRESKKEILEIKTRLLSEIYIQSYDELCSMNNEKKEKFLKNILLSVKKSEFKFEKIICNKKDHKILKEILTDSTIKLIIKEDIQGLIFTRNNEKEILDMTFNTILKDKYEEIESKLQKTLFNI